MMRTTQSSRETIFAPGLHNVATNWYNDGVMVSNVTESGVLAQVAYDALRRETARIDGRGNVSRTRYDALGRVAATIDALTNATAYAYDAAGRRIARAHSGTAFLQSDTFNYTYNIKSELTNAVAVADANYTDTSALFVSPRETFTPLFDADGNQTLVKTATGTWQVSYNGENRPILWTCGATNIVMSYDRMGRRVTKSAECGGQSEECCRFVYDGYLQIANRHSTSTPTPSPYTYFIWDPTEPIATRPLVWFNSALDTPHSALYYTHDGNKNVSEVIAQDGGIASHYEYAPFGAVTAQTGYFAAANPWRFSSEFADDELGCDFYNYREYEPMTGRWMQRDLLKESSGLNLLAFVRNGSVLSFDCLGLVDAQACGKGAQSKNRGKDGFFFTNNSSSNGYKTVFGSIRSGLLDVNTQKPIEAAGKVDLGALKISACCECDAKAGTWALRISVASSYTVMVALGGRTHPWGERSPDGIRMSLEHERLHVKAFESVLGSFYNGLVGSFANRTFPSFSVCSKAWGNLNVQEKIRTYQKNWKEEGANQFLHQGRDWDEWRAKGYPDETSKEMW